MFNFTLRFFSQFPRNFENVREKKFIEISEHRDGLALLIALEHVRAKKKMMHFACFAENLRLFEKVQKDIQGHRSRQALSLFFIILSFSMKMIRSIIPTSILLRKSALIQSRTSLPRFVSFASC